ncbi:MAG: immune inhibitor A [Ardenticatenaceae bacterium]|nr:immune inhibitor A [Ardenticatenaceae bacterium]MCB9442614.1 immune inhibitor A [Ardenticatenaceae bacterium]
MKRNYWFVVIFIALAMVSLFMIASGPAQAAQPLPDYQIYDVGPELREWDATPDRIQGGLAALSQGEIDALEAEALAAVASTPYTECVLDSKLWLSLDNYLGRYFFTTFYLVAETDGSELWVQADLSWPAGDPRPTPVVTCEQAAYLLGEFDNNMYPVETDFYGMPDVHDGTYSLLEDWGYVPPGYYYNETGRQVVLVSNVRDDSYYDYTYPNYIAGFYSPTFEAYFDRNIMSIDSYAWEERVGPDGSRPYLYEGVFAHEYQHLLHDDYDADEVELINEGLSMFAEFLTGYVVGNDAYSTFEALPENSLTAWEDQGGREVVADYGLVFLFQMYLYEKYGQEFIQYEFMNQDNGVSSIESTLDAFNVRKSFGDIYHDFSVAVLIDNTRRNYRYGFELLDVGIDIGTPDAPNPDAYDTPGAPPWGTDYIWLDGDPQKLGKLTFNGVDYSVFPSPWTSDGDVLFSGTGDLLDNWAIFETVGGGTLSFDTIYDLEDYWDFAFVQVSVDGGYTWMSLEDNEGYSTYDYDPNAHPTVIANLPGLTSWLDDWVTLSYDLSPYAGQDILVAFRLVTDWATHYGGWWIDNVYVDDVLISDGSDVSIFKDITEIVPINNDFTVTFVGYIYHGKGNQKIEYKVVSMKLDDMTEDGWFELNKVLKNADSAVMLVTFDAPEGFTGYADYTYDFTYVNGHNKPKKPIR